MQLVLQSIRKKMAVFLGNLYLGPFLIRNIIHSNSSHCLTLLFQHFSSEIYILNYYTPACFKALYKWEHLIQIYISLSERLLLLLLLDIGFVFSSRPSLAFLHMILTHGVCVCVYIFRVQDWRCWVSESESCLESVFQVDSTYTLP